MLYILRPSSRVDILEVAMLLLITNVLTVSITFMFNKTFCIELLYMYYVHCLRRTGHNNVHITHSQAYRDVARPVLKGRFHKFTEASQLKSSMRQ